MFLGMHYLLFLKGIFYISIFLACLKKKIVDSYKTYNKIPTNVIYVFVVFQYHSFQGIYAPIICSKWLGMGSCLNNKVSCHGVHKSLPKGLGYFLDIVMTVIQDAGYIEQVGYEHGHLEAV